MITWITRAAMSGMSMCGAIIPRGRVRYRIESLQIILNEFWYNLQIENQDGKKNVQIQPNFKLPVFKLSLVHSERQIYRNNKFPNSIFMP